MKTVKKIFLVISSIIISIVAIYRIYENPEMASRVFFLILIVFFMSFALFLIFENQIKATPIYNTLDEKYLSKKVPYFGHELEFPHLAYLVIGSNLLSILFLYIFFTDSIPFEKGTIMLYLFYIISPLFLIGSIYFTILIVQYLKKINAGKA